MTVSTPTRTLDIRALPGTRETLAYQNGGLFPVMDLAADGTAVAAVRGGAGHLGREGRMEAIRSTDGGLTWSQPYLIADSDDDDRNAAFGVSSKGTLVLLYHRQHNYDAEGNYQGGLRSASGIPISIMATRSFDGGLSWEEPSALSIDSLPTGSPFGKIVSLADGTLVAPVYNFHAWGGAQSKERIDNAYVVRSKDDGCTWGDVSLIAPNKNETALIALPNGDLLAVLRGSDSPQGLHSARSADGGRTWSAPVQVTQPRQHPADLIRLSNGDILFVYGNRNPPYRIEGLVSRDGGHTWLDLLLTFSGHLYGYTREETRATDLGYPSSVVGTDSRGITMYYYNPDMRTRRDSRQRAGNPLYGHTNYCAVAVSWQEDELIAAVDSAIGGQ